jgi:hypothetical protein
MKWTRSDAPGAAGFLVPTCSLNADLRGFLWLLTSPRGRRYSIGMVRRGNSPQREKKEFLSFNLPAERVLTIPMDLAAMEKGYH